MKKKVLAITFAALMLFTTTVSAGSEAKTIEVEDSNLNISVNLSEFEEDVFVYNDTLYAPLLETVEAMGGTYDLNSKNDSLVVSSAPISTYELLAVDGSTLTEDVKNACNTMMSDMAMLLSFSSCLPKFYAFIEDVQHIKKLADLGLYKEAQESFKECITLLLELKSEMVETDKAYYDSISEYSSLMYDAYCKTIQAALFESSNVMSNLARYVNLKQINESVSAEERKIKKGCNNILNLQGMIEHIDVRIPISYLFAYSNNNKEIEELSDLIMSELKQDFGGLNWYKEYINLKDGFDFPFDNPDIIPSIVIYEKDSSIESDVPEKGTEDINVSVAKSTTPVSLNNISNIPSQDIVSEGSYKVGYDILPGEYIVICTDDIFSAYVCVKDANTNKIKENDNFDGCHYINISLGQYFEISRAIAIPADKYNINVPDYNSIGDGMYKVGTDIPVGEYKLTADTDFLGYYCIYDTADASRKIIANDNFSNTSYVNVKLGQYLQIKRSNAVLVSSPYNY